MGILSTVHPVDRCISEHGWYINIHLQHNLDDLFVWPAPHTPKILEYLTADDRCRASDIFPQGTNRSRASQLDHQ